MQGIKQLFLRRRRYDDLSVSIREHLQERIEELMEDGMSKEEATRTARREFGNVSLIEERSREVWQWPTLESIWADAKFSLRQLGRSPGFTISALLTLGTRNRSEYCRLQHCQRRSVSSTSIFTPRAARVDRGESDRGDARSRTRC